MADLTTRGAAYQAASFTGKQTPDNTQALILFWIVDGNAGTKRSSLERALQRKRQKRGIIDVVKYG